MIALAGITMSAIAKMQISLMNPIDMYFSSDYKLIRYIDMTLAQYTRLSRIVSSREKV